VIPISKVVLLILDLFSSRNPYGPSQTFLLIPLKIVACRFQS
jgi:hypothetical protein